MMQEARQHVDAGRYAEAEALYRTAVDEDPGNTEALYMLALVRQRQGDLTEAIKLMQSASAQEPESPTIHFALGNLQMAVKSLDEARQSYLRALQIDPFHVGAHNGVAYAELSAGNLKAAEKAANLALTEDPKNVQALVFMGTARLEQGEYTKAISYLREALTEAPDHQVAQVQLGRAFLAAGNAGFAMQCFQNAVEAQPESGVAWDYLGTAQFANKMIEEAAGSFQRALSLGRTVPEVYRGLAECQRLLGLPDQAQQTLAQAGQVLGSDPELALVDKLLARDEPPVVARLYKGFHLCREGNAEGIEMLQEVEREPELSKADQRRVRKMLAITLDRMGRFEEAAGYFAELSGHLAQVVALAGGGARANRELLEAGQIPANAPRPIDPELPADPVFLLAWPGSGWEWLASGLGAHSGVMLILDQPATQTGRRALISQPAGVRALASRSPKATARAVRRYWNDLKGGGLEPGDRMTVDAMWLSADMPPTLASLFPASRVIVVRREPEEMVLEWFRAGYADLEDMARTWVDQQQVLAQYREALDLEYIDVNGSRLLQDPAAELRQLFAALGLEWESAVDEKLAELAPITDAPRGTWRDYRAVLAAPLALVTGEPGDSRGQESVS